MMVWHDQNECNNCGFCLLQAPTVFTRGDQGQVGVQAAPVSALAEYDVAYERAVSVTSVSAGLAEPVRRAAEVCPREAISCSN